MLNAKQTKAVIMLASGSSGKDAAEKVGVTVQTLCGWKKDHRFQAQLNGLQRESLNSALIKLRNYANLVVDQLAEIALQAESDETRRKACVDLLSLVNIGNPSSVDWEYGLGADDAHECQTKALQKSHGDALVNDLLGIHTDF